MIDRDDIQHETRSPEVEWALNLLEDRRVTYGDARWVHLRHRVVSAKNGHPSLLEEKEGVGIGIRALKDGALGFACTPDLSRRGLRKAVGRALETAEASSQTRKKFIRLAHESPAQAYWETPLQIDPWQIDPREQMDRLIRCEEIMRRDRRVLLSESRMEFTRKEQIFGSTEGSLIESVRFMTGGGIFCKAFGRGEVQRRSYPSPSKDFRAQGYEFIPRLRLEENAERIREEALLLLKSPPCPSKSMDIILRDSILALQIHESIGHAAELDRVYGYEDNLGGRTYLTPEKCGKFRVGSGHVTVVANRHGERDGVGFVAYDDEGIPARETVIVDRGWFKGYLSSRETAHFLRLPHSSGSMIAEDWSYLPIIRMTHLSLLPGEHSLEELLGEVGEGLLLDTESSWSIDEERGDFQIGGEIAWHIKQGKVVGAFKNPLYRGHSLNFWQKCAGVADETSFRLSGFADCGKGGPYQQAFVSHGSSPALFRKVDCYAACNGKTPMPKSK